MDGDVARLVITHKDRLLRFGSELVFAICEYHGAEIIILNRKEDATFEEDLASDVLEVKNDLEYINNLFNLKVSINEWVINTK